MDANQIEKLEYEIYNTTKEILKRKQKSLDDRKKIFDNTNSIMSYTYTS